MALDAEVNNYTEKRTNIPLNMFRLTKEIRRKIESATGKSVLMTTPRALARTSRSVAPVTGVDLHIIKMFFVLFFFSF